MTQERQTKTQIPPVILHEPKRKPRTSVLGLPYLGWVPPEARSYGKRIREEHIPLIKQGLTPARQKKQFDGPAGAARHIKALARSIGADLVGICRLRDAWIYAECKVPASFAVSLAMEMDAGKIDKAPQPEATIETLRVYHDLGEVTIKLAQEIAGMGYQAFPQHPFVGAHDILHVPVAADAGLGVLGRNGILITKEFGPRVRLGAVATDLELQPDEPPEFDETVRLCLRCHACRKACPGKAIPDEPTVDNGVLKFKLDVEKCRPYFRKYVGCSICIKVCPLSQSSLKS